MSGAADTGKGNRIGAAIRAARKVAGFTQVQLAAALGIDQTRTSTWERGAAVPSLDQIAAVEAALGLGRGELLVAAGYVKGAGVEGAILADPDLSDAEREFLLAVYRAAGRTKPRRQRRRA